MLKGMVLLCTLNIHNVFATISCQGHWDTAYLIRFCFGCILTFGVEDSMSGCKIEKKEDKIILTRVWSFNSKKL